MYRLKISFLFLNDALERGDKQCFIDKSQIKTRQSIAQVCRDLKKLSGNF